MISLPFLKKMNVDSISNAWKSNISCGECSTRLSVFRKKKICFFCKNSFCQVCIMQREDKKFCCRKCQILTARPLDKSELLNLKSRDLVNYLTSRHISTNGCVEKEDLVNVLIRAVNNSCFHSHSSTPLDSTSCANSYPNTPINHSYSANKSNCNRNLSHSAENLFNQDGIRITGFNANEEDLHQSSPVEYVNIPQQEYSSGQSQVTLNDSEPQSSQINEENNVAMSTDDSCADNNDIACKISPNLSSFKPLMLSDIKDKYQLEALSVKQLKELLMRNRTDFKGCIERQELLQKAKRLWNDYISSRQDLDNLGLEELCKICMDAPIECVLLECGHMATCIGCGKQLFECPICRQLVVRCVRTFRA